MFEDEIKMEEKSGNWVPLLMALGLALAIIGGVAYFIVESKRALSPTEATALVTDILQEQGTAQVHFHVGKVEPSVDEKPFDPHYRLLEKAGVVKLGKPTYKGIDVQLTPQGRELLQTCGATDEKNPDGTEAFTVPLAKRKLVEVSKVEMVRPGLAKVEYVWKWEPTKLGDSFDVKSPELTSMKGWDRALLIEKYGADFYKNGEAKKMAIKMAWDDKSKSWKPAVE